MKLNVLFAPPASSSEEYRDCTVVIIDTLRATSTIIAALAAGAREAIPTTTTKGVYTVAEYIGTDHALLCGERGGLKIEGFHCGNSPLEFTPDVVREKSLVMTTTNGTVAMLAARYSRQMYCGALLNADAVAYRLFVEGGNHCTVICSGTEGRFALEDTLAAGAIVARLIEYDSTLELTDSARAAMILFGHVQHDLSSALCATDHGMNLLRLGMKDDVEYCSQLDLFDIVPVLSPPPPNDVYMLSFKIRP